MSEITEGVCSDGAAILEDGIPLPITEILNRLKQLERLRTALPIEQWAEEDGPCLWWSFPIKEPPYPGTPLDTDWPGGLTHWTPLRVPVGQQRNHT